MYAHNDNYDMEERVNTYNLCTTAVIPKDKYIYIYTRG